MELKSYAVVTHSNQRSGGSALAFTIVKALNEAGYTPDLYATECGQTDERWGELKYNIRQMNLKTYPVLKLYQSPKLPVDFSEHEFVWDVSSYLPRHTAENCWHWIFNLVTEDLDLTHGGWKSLYALPYCKLMPYIERMLYSNKKLKASAQSKYIQKILEDRIGRTFPLIYPPVSLALFKPKTEQTRTGVISIGRISPHKHQFEQVKIAELLPEIPFRIIGDVYDKAYLQRMKNYIKEKSIKNVTFSAPPSSELIDIMHKSKYFIHSCKKEHFGIVVPEAIAAGCIPIVYDGGGPRETVPYRELRYINITEAKGIFKRCEQEGFEDIKKLQEHNKQFDEKVFKQKVMEIGGVNHPFRKEGA